MSTSIESAEAQPKMNSESVFRRLWETVGQGVAFDNEMSEEVLESAKERMKVPFREGHYNYEFMEIDFDDIVYCTGYTLRVATSHSVMVESATELFFNSMSPRMLDSLLSKPCLRVTSVGGGPGSDLLGFYAALRKRRHAGAILQVSGTVLDYFSGWEEVIDKLREIVPNFSELSTGSVLDVNFSQADLVGDIRDIIKDVEELRKADVVLIVKVLSVLPLRERDAILENVLNCMKPRSLLIFVDTGAELLKETVRKNYRKFRVIHGPTDRLLTTTDLPYRDFVTQSSYQLCVVQRRKVRAVNANVCGQPKEN